MRITKNGEAMCRNDEGTCERALCECDAMFAREHVAASSVYTDDNHMFYSKTGWNPEEECIAGGGSTDPKCCGTPAGPYFLFNGNNPNKKCCADGTVKADCNGGNNTNYNGGGSGNNNNNNNNNNVISNRSEIDIGVLASWNVTLGRPFRSGFSQTRPLALVY